MRHKYVYAASQTKRKIGNDWILHKHPKYNCQISLYIYVNFHEEYRKRYLTRYNDSVMSGEIPIFFGSAKPGKESYINWTNGIKTKRKKIPIDNQMI